MPQTLDTAPVNLPGVFTSTPLTDFEAESMSTRPVTDTPASPMASAPLAPHTNTPAGSPVYTPAQLDAMLKASLVHVGEERTPPEISAEIVADDKHYPIATNGSFSVVIGKAKSRKTRFTELVASAYLHTTGRIQNVNSPIATKQKVVAWFDTEQGKYYAGLSVDRIAKMAELSKGNTHLLFFDLRMYDPGQRIAMIERFVETTPNLGLLVLDGLRDVAYSINDEKEATTTISRVLRWTAQYCIHVMAILHENKNDPNARGHLGAEAMNKAETVHRVTKDKETGISTVEPVYCRGIEYPKFGFYINEETGLPSIVDNGDLPKAASDRSERKTIYASHYELHMHKDVLRAIVARNPNPKRAELVMGICAEFQGMGIQFGKSKGEEFLQWHIKHHLIQSPSPGKSGYTFTLDKTPPNPA